jgi:hypothetical protein
MILPPDQEKSPGKILLNFVDKLWKTLKMKIFVVDKTIPDTF